MKIISPYFEILTEITGDELVNIERVARVCYKSEDKMTKDSAERLVAALIKSGHEAMLEHGAISVRFVCDRGTSHQIVRHRMASYAQESTRIDYTKEKFDGEITVIEPLVCVESEEVYKIWQVTMLDCEWAYIQLIKAGVKPKEARCVLPTSLKTELIMTANYREWRHFLRLRTAPDAHIEIRRLTIPLLKELKNRIPVLFDDILEG